MMKSFVLAVLSVILTSVLSFSQSFEKIEELYDKGDYKAVEMQLDSLNAASPNNASVSYWRARLAFKRGDHAAGLETLKTAANKGSLEAYPLLMDYYLGNYDVNEAKNVLRNWRQALTKAKVSEPEGMEHYDDLLVRLSNQMARIEDMPVIARYGITRKQFDDALKQVNRMDARKGPIYIGNTPFFINNTNREFFWTQPDEEGVNRLFMAGILDDGRRDEAIELTKYIGDGDIIAPYLMEDGETLYFAAKRADGIGGYDLYMTRRNDDGGFYEPSNLGIPYNSTRDDLMFVMDEMNNIGWWITNRSIDPDSLTVFVFVPNETRVNLPSDADDLMGRAALTDISQTLPKNFNVNEALGRLPKPQRQAERMTPTKNFELSLGNGRVLTQMSQFKSREAAKAMSDMLRDRQIIADDTARLNAMRTAFANGDTSLTDDIKRLEQEVELKQSELRKLTNRIISLETAAQ